MDKNTQLKAMIDGIIKGDDAAASAAFSPYIQSKTREVLGYPHPTPQTTPVNEGFVVKLQEWVDAQDESPVQFRGDRVLIDGQQKGVIQNDPTDFESGINFIEDGGKFSKEFDSVEAFYDFLIDRYTKKGAV